MTYGTCFFLQHTGKTSVKQRTSFNEVTYQCLSIFHWLCGLHTSAIPHIKTVSDKFSHYLILLHAQLPPPPPPPPTLSIDVIKSNFKLSHQSNCYLLTHTSGQTFFNVYKTNQTLKCVLFSMNIPFWDISFITVAKNELFFQ